VRNGVISTVLYGQASKSSVSPKPQFKLTTLRYAQLYISEIYIAIEVPNLPLPLIERSKEEIIRRIKRKVENLEGVKECRQLNVRMIGKRFDVSMRLLLNDALKLEDAHRIALDVEKEVKGIIPNARVAIDTGSSGNGKENVWKLVKDIAEGVPGSRGVHNIHVQKINGELCVDLHLEVSANMTVKQAHRVADEVEKRIKAANSRISEITVHIESASGQISRELAGIERELESYIEHVAEGFPEIKDVCGIEVRRFGDALHIVLRCRFDPELRIRKAHEIANQLESAIRRTYPNVVRIDIHEEPA